MKERILLTILISLYLPFQAISQIGIFQNSADIGNPKLGGKTEYNEANGHYSLTGSGYNIWFDRDEFHYAFHAISGNFLLTANVAFEGEGVDPHRKVGWMVRSNDSENAAHVSAVIHGDGLTVLQWRPEANASMRDPEDEIISKETGFAIIQLEKWNDTFIMRAALPGKPFIEIGRKELHLGDNLLAGIFISSHNPDVIEKAKFWNVRIEKTVPDNYDAYSSGFLSSRMEIMDVFSGERKVIYEKDGRFEAPNWMPDGNQLLFNMDGGMFTLDINGGEPRRLETGEANNNNNDHGISFNGKLLAVSHHREGLPDGGSSIYVLPLKGGAPKLVTQNTPSYWHGWNPNNKEVVYVAKRNGDVSYNIFSANIKNGKEKQLTFFEGSHVDGPEFSPGGKYIYYNGSQSGVMQLWRMKPDGSDKEQLTFDEYFDWFPHISPDGKWIAFLSFPNTIGVNDHPFYKRVMLRLMPAGGGPIQTIAYLYGGQGTINVPSWSPDSKKIAFVSNFGK